MGPQFLNIQKYSWNLLYLLYEVEKPESQIELTQLNLKFLNNVQDFDFVGGGLSSVKYSVAAQ